MIDTLLGREDFNLYLEATERISESTPTFVTSPTETITVDSDIELQNSMYGQLEVVADNVEIDCNGHILVAAKDPARAGISVMNRSNVTISDCVIGLFGIGVHVTNSTSIQISNVDSLVNNEGFRIENSSSTMLDLNTAYYNDSNGFSLRDSITTILYKNISNRNRDGYDENRCTDSYYIINEAKENNVNGFESDFGTNPVYQYSTIISNGQHGISLDAVSSPFFERNKIIGSGEDGLRLDDEVDPNTGINIGTVNGIVTTNVSLNSGGHAAHQCAPSLCTGNNYINNTFVGTTNNIQ